uniref:Ground-like domain-containing protein n=1 Tax=Syphacia muris TaxID=451379 RepID=A0A158R4H6_9BILA
MPSSLLLFPILILLTTLCATAVFNGKHFQCKSLSIRELIMKSIGTYPHNPAAQASLLSDLCRQAYGDYWSAVIVPADGAYTMKEVVDTINLNTSCEYEYDHMTYWIGRTALDSCIWN